MVLPKLCEECDKVERELSNKIRERRAIDPESPISDLLLTPFENMCDVCSWETLKVCEVIADKIRKRLHTIRGENQ